MPKISDILLGLREANKNLEDAVAHLTAILAEGRTRLLPENTEELEKLLQGIDSQVSKAYIVNGEFKKIERVEEKLNK